MRNRYTEDKAASGEIMRLLLQKMPAHPAAFNPTTYAVWYEYLTGVNLPLNKSLTEMLDSGQLLTDDAIYSLYCRHIADGNPDAEKFFKQSMQEMLDNLGRFAEMTDGEAGKYNAELQKHGETLRREISAEALKGLVSNIAQETQSMRSSVDFLQDKLHDSKSEVERLQQELMSARSEALVDPLTGVFNRRGFEVQIKNLIVNPEMRGKFVSFLMLDIDFFKKVNDTYGHLFGDKVIRLLADALKAQVKGQDSVARMGGEEFAVILPDTPLQGAKAVAEHIRCMIEKGKIQRLDKQGSVGGITVSIGIAGCQLGEDWSVAMGHADEALYVSKQTGRNRSTIYTPAD